MKKFTAKNLKETRAIAKKFAGILKPGDIAGFSGQLGAGKTTFIKEIAGNFGLAPREITSASFIIMKTHKAAIPICHVDLYRLNLKQVPDEVYERIFANEGLVLIEWSDKISLPRDHFKVTMKILSLDSRR